MVSPYLLTNNAQIFVLKAKVIQLEALFCLNTTSWLIYQDAFPTPYPNSSGSFLVFSCYFLTQFLKSDGDRKHLKWPPQWDDSRMILGRFVSQCIVHLIHSILSVSWKNLTHFHLLSQFPSPLTSGMNPLLCHGKFSWHSDWVNN